MSDSRAPRSPEGESPPFVLMLFVAGYEPNSRLAREHLAELCEGLPNGRCRVEIIDVLEDFDAAAKHSILLTPTLLRIKPAPMVRLIGNLSDREKVHRALQLK